MSRGFQFLVYVFFCFAAAHGFAVSVYADKPIPSGKDVPTEAKWNDELFAHRRTELEIYKKLTKDQPEVQKDVSDFLEGYLKRLSTKPMHLRGKLSKSGAINCRPPARKTPCSSRRSDSSKQSWKKRKAWRWRKPPSRRFPSRSIRRV